MNNANAFMPPKNLLNCCHTDQKKPKGLVYTKSSCDSADALVAKTIRMSPQVAQGVKEQYPDLKVCIVPAWSF